MPQWDGKQNMASEIYVKLLNAFYDEVKAVNPNAQVVVGGTAPYGDDPPGGPNRTQPIRFYQELLCLNTKNKKATCPAGEPPKFDIFAHHPINREDPPTEKADNKATSRSPTSSADEGPAQGGEARHHPAPGKHEHLGQRGLVADQPARQGRGRLAQDARALDGPGPLPALEAGRDQRHLPAVPRRQVQAGRVHPGQLSDRRLHLRRQAQAQRRRGRVPVRHRPAGQEAARLGQSRRSPAS